MFGLSSFCICKMETSDSLHRIVAKVKGDQREALSPVLVTSDKVYVV